ncbi:MAG: hypothetical protein Q7R59_02225 [bacterium]|nr:hypothetical protein [bacterium]
MQQTEQINVEYFFRLIYQLFYGSHAGFNYAGFQSAIAHLWLWIIYIGYILSILAFIIIIYLTIQLFELRKREEVFYTTLIVPPETAGGDNPRWLHIQSLAESASPSEWREAIIEADIMLDDLLTERGYVGAGVGEKLKAVEPRDVATLQDAWEAHKVRNQIAHEGSAFGLSESLARRTIAHYEAVFRELKAI